MGSASFYLFREKEERTKKSLISAASAVCMGNFPIAPNIERSESRRKGVGNAVMVSQPGAVQPYIRCHASCK